MRAVINDLGRTHRSSGLAIIYTHTVSAACYIARVDTVTAQRVNSSLSDLMCRQFTYKTGVEPVIGAAYSHIRLAAAPYGVKAVYLYKPFITFRRKPEHNLAECHDLCHVFYSFTIYNTFYNADPINSQ